MRSRPQGELPTREQAVLAWLSAILLMWVAGFGVLCLAATAGLVSGVEPRDLLALLNDPTASPLVSAPGWIALGVLANETALALAVVYWVRRLKIPWRSVLPLERPTLLSLCAACCIVFGLAPLAELASYGMSLLTGTEASAARAITLAARTASPSDFALLTATVALLPALAEEAMFRGFVTLPFLRRSVFQAVIFPSLLFGIFHLDFNQGAGTFVLALGFAAARLLSGSLLSAIFVHAVYNAAVVLAVRFGADADEGGVKWRALAVGAVLIVAGWALFKQERKRRRA